MVSGLTEACWDMGLADRVAAVSTYCPRYVDIGARPIAGSYLQIDETMLREMDVDLIIMTGGVQLGLARRLAVEGFPVYVLPVPDSFPGILDNIRKLGALFDAMPQAHKLVSRMEKKAVRLRELVSTKRPRVYTELWLGRHPRTIGGLTFIHDLIEIAGGENVGAGIAGGYLKLDLAGVVEAKPDVVLVFWEEDDTPIDVPALLKERGWFGKWDFQVIEAGIQRGRNLIHDGPSILETASWLNGML
jgi:ABC-type Fe3+-hydroxamate transport system substrate-binding protein